MKKIILFLALISSIYANQDFDQLLIDSCNAKAGTAQQVVINYFFLGANDAISKKYTMESVLKDISNVCENVRSTKKTDAVYKMIEDKYYSNILIRSVNVFNSMQKNTK